MGIRKGRGTLHPKYFGLGSEVLQGDMIALIEIIRPTGSTSEPVWIEDDNLPFGGDYLWEDATPLWRGRARAVPNKDWRARNRTWAQEQTAEHALRVQLDLRKNLLVDPEDWPAPLVDVWHGDIVKVVNNFADPILELYSFTVRNAIGASDAWHRTLLCDVNLGSRLSSG